MIGDKIVLPFDQQPYYAEKIVQLADCYLANDAGKPISPQVTSRGARGASRAGLRLLLFQQQLQAFARRVRRRVDAAARKCPGKHAVACRKSTSTRFEICEAKRAASLQSGRPDREGGADPCGPRRGSLASVRSDHAALRGVCVVGVGRHDLSRPEGLGFLACERPPEGLQAGRRGDHGVQKNFAVRVAEIRATLAPGTPIEVWFQDEMRVGQKNKLTIAGPQRARVPAPSTTNARNRPMCSVRSAPELGTGAALVLPACNTEAMQLHLNEIATKVTLGAHAILILDQAGWHGAKDLKAPANISLLPLPPRGAQSSRKHLAVYAGEPAVEPCLQILRRHRRSLLLRLEHAHRPALENNVHCPLRLGTRRSLIVRVGSRPPQISIRPRK